MYNGIYVYYGMGFSGAGMEIIRPGNRVCIVGSVSEFQGTYQVSGIQYREMRPNDPENIKQLDEEVHAPAYVPTTAETFLGTREVEVDDEIMEYSYAELALHSSISISNLKVERTYTTSSDTSSKGDITIYCTVGGKEIVIRTSDLTDDEGNLVNASLFEGKTIDVKGIVDCYISNDGTKTYQIKLLSLDNLTIHQEEQQ
jgi:DNA/RNA endonuclease YhcR with UshA esterase domain